MRPAAFAADSVRHAVQSEPSPWSRTTWFRLSQQGSFPSNPLMRLSDTPPKRRARLNMASQNNTEPQQMQKEFNRRTFFTRLGFGSLGIAAAGTLSFAYQFLSPNVLFEASPIINAGKPESYPLDSVTLDANSRIYLIHSKEGFFSLSAVCTHLGCLT